MLAVASSESSRFLFVCLASVFCAGEPLSFRLDEFLDTFYGHIRDGDFDLAQAAIDEEPPPLHDKLAHAYIAAVAEHLARRWRLRRIPAWTNGSSRFLEEPSFPFDDAGAKALYFVESPIAFRRRLIFIEANPLRRATMARIK